MFSRICNPTEGNIRIYNPIKAVQTVVNDDFSGLQILIFRTSGLQIPMNILGDKNVLAAKTTRMFRRICNPTEGNIRICNPIKAVQTVVNDDFSGLQILIFAAAGLQIRQNILGDKNVQAELTHKAKSEMNN